MKPVACFFVCSSFNYCTETLKECWFAQLGIVAIDVKIWNEPPWSFFNDSSVKIYRFHEGKHDAAICCGISNLKRISNTDVVQEEPRLCWAINRDFEEVVLPLSDWLTDVFVFFVVKTCSTSYLTHSVDIRWRYHDFQFILQVSFTDWRPGFTLPNPPGVHLFSILCQGLYHGGNRKGIIFFQETG